jgi:transcriptional regulator with XRE-family HTH domain
MLSTAQRIKELANRRGLTRLELAAKASVSYKTLYNVMQAKHEPRESILKRIADALGTTPEYLLGTKGALEVRESSAGCAARGEEGARVCHTMRDAIRFIAAQLDLAEEIVAAKIGELMKDHVKGGPQ